MPPEIRHRACRKTIRVGVKTPTRTLRYISYLPTAPSQQGMRISVPPTTAEHARRPDTCEAIAYTGHKSCRPQRSRPPPNLRTPPRSPHEKPPIIYDESCRPSQQAMQISVPATTAEHARRPNTCETVAYTGHKSCRPQRSRPPPNLRTPPRSPHEKPPIYTTNPADLRSKPCKFPFQLRPQNMLADRIRAKR